MPLVEETYSMVDLVSQHYVVISPEVFYLLGFSIALFGVVTGILIGLFLGKRKYEKD